jgi:Scavenger mRNA decapping enzyme C-term binding
MRGWLMLALGLVLGIALGGALFIDARPRTPLSLTQCGESCWEARDVVGLVASAQLRTVPSWTPMLLDQSARCVAVSHWRPEAPYHRVYLPKRDLKNVMEVSEQDWPYLSDCLAMAAKHVKAQGITNYRLITNGPALQHLTYFHFHVIAR